jgi:hypothetical protein
MARNLTSWAPYSSSKIRLASGPKNGTSHRSSVSATSPLAPRPYPNTAPERALTILVSPQSQIPNHPNIPQQQHPAQETRPRKHKVHHKHRTKQQRRLPRMEPAHTYQPYPHPPKPPQLTSHNHSSTPPTTTPPPPQAATPNKPNTPHNPISAANSSHNHAAPRAPALPSPHPLYSRTRRLRLLHSHRPAPAAGCPTVHPMGWRGRVVGEAERRTWSGGRWGGVRACALRRGRCLVLVSLRARPWSRSGKANLGTVRNPF